MMKAKSEVAVNPVTMGLEVVLAVATQDKSIKTRFVQFYGLYACSW